MSSFNIEDDSRKIIYIRRHTWCIFRCFCILLGKIKAFVNHYYTAIY